LFLCNTGGRDFRWKETALYSNLRFVISASFVGCAGLIAVLALLPATFEERLLASDAASAQPCNPQHWLQLDRNCLSRRGMPWVADAPAPNSAATATESVPEQAVPEQAVPEQAARKQAVTETQSSATAAERQAIEATAPRQDAPAAPVVAEEGPGTTQRSDITAPQPSVPQQHASAPPVAAEPPPPVTAERHIPRQRSEPSRHAAPAVHEKQHAAKPAVEPQTPAPAPKKTARDARGAKPADEALNAVRRFQDNLRDIPVSSYAGDGTRRTIMIRPTSIQDVYYYSAPR
jgi:hypothetical protein